MLHFEVRTRGPAFSAHISASMNGRHLRSTYGSNDERRLIARCCRTIQSQRDDGMGGRWAPWANAEKPCWTACACNRGDVRHNTSSMTQMATYLPTSSGYEHM